MGAVEQHPHKSPLFTEHPSHTSHLTLVLESIHTCQGREHSRPKSRVETSAVRSAPTHKPAHQSKDAVHDTLLQLLKTNSMISRSTVFQVRYVCRFYLHKSPLYTEHPSHTSHSSSNRFTHVKGGNTHRLNVESRRQPYGPHPHTNHHIKVSTLYTTHSSNFSKQTV